MAIFGPSVMPEKVVSVINYFFFAISLYSTDHLSLSLSLCIAPPSINCNPHPRNSMDVLELTLDIGGLPVVVADTTGLRETDDLVEGIGVQRGVEAFSLFFSLTSSILLTNGCH